MQFVQLVVPQHLYDELGLHPNQTIALSRSQSTGKPQTHGNIVITPINSGDASNQYQESFRTDPKISNTDNEKGNTSFFDSERLGNGVTNVENGKQLTYHLKSTTLLSNSQNEVDASENESISNISNDVDSSIEETDSTIPLGDPEKKSVFLAQSFFKSHNFLQGKSDCNTKDDRPEIYPKHCQKCLKLYKSKDSFRKHRKRCGNRKQKVIYPRRCEKCDRTYSCKNSFCSHKRRCGLSVPKYLYPRTCPFCKRIYDCSKLFNKHSCREKRKVKSATQSSSGCGKVNSSTSNTSASYNSGDANKDTGAASDQDTSEKWIPVKIGSRNSQRYFVVHKTSPSQN